jgi:parallel beta-helix repeat protein
MRRRNKLADNVAYKQIFLVIFMLGLLSLSIYLNPEITGKVVQEGTWIAVEDENYVGGSALFSNTISSKLIYNLTGRVTLITQTRDDFGIMEVYVDGMLTDSIDLYSSEVIYDVRKEYDISSNLILVVSDLKNEASAGYYVVVDEVLINETVPEEKKTFSKSGSYEMQDSAAAPVVSFLPPTYTNGTIDGNTSIEINISTIEYNLNKFIWNWNTTNYSLYDNGLVLMVDCNNVSSLGENNSAVKDFSKYSATGIVWGNAAPVARGRYGGGCNFTGWPGEINFTRTAALSTENITISAWIWSKSPPLPDAAMDIVSYGPDAHYITVTGNGKFLGGIQYVVDEYIEGTVTVNDGKWHHVAMTRDADTDNVVIYVDGVSDGSYHSLIGLTFDDPIIIGSDAADADAYSEGFNGTIDEVRIWNRPFSLNEIKQVYYSSLSKFNATQWYFYANESNLTYDTYTYYGSAKDNDSNEASTDKRTIIIGTGSDITPPTLSNFINITSDRITYWFSAQSSENSNCTLYGNWSGTWAKNETRWNVTANIPFNFTSITFARGINNSLWTVNCSDTSANVGWGANNSFTIKAYTPPNASSVSIVPSSVNTNIPEVGGIWTYSDVDSDTENATVYEWYINGTNAWRENGLLHYLKFDQNVSDEMGHATAYSVNSAPTNATGKILGSYQFDGDNDYVKISGASHPENYTVALWVRPYNISDVNIIERGSSGGPRENSYHKMVITSDNKFKHSMYQLGSPIEVTVTGSTDVVIGRWYHVTITAGGGYARLYVNGIEEGTAAPITIVNSIGTEYYIGSDAMNYAGYFNGSIDEVMIWNRSLSAQEVSDLYNMTKYGQIDQSGANHTIANLSARYYSTSTTLKFSVTPYDGYSYGTQVNSTIVTVIDLNVPAISNQHNFTTDLVTYTFLAVSSESGSCTLYGNWTGTWRKNETKSVIESIPFNFTTIQYTSNGKNYAWGVNCSDVSGNVGWGTNESFGIYLNRSLSECRLVDSSGVYNLTSSILNSDANVCFNITANDVVFDCLGNTIDSDTGNYGFYAERALQYTNTNITIRNCTITDWQSDAVYFTNTGNNLFENLIVNSSLNALEMYDSANVTIRHSDINTLTSGYAITVDNLPGLQIDDNKISSKYPLYLYSANDSIIKNNHLISELNAEGAGYAAGVGIYFYGGVRSIISNNTLFGLSYGMWIDNDNTNDSREIIVANNTITYCADYGIYTVDAYNHTYVGNYIDHSFDGYGLIIVDSAVVDILNNTALNSYYTGIGYWDCAGGTAANNIVRENGIVQARNAPAFDLDSLSNGTVFNNDISFNYGPGADFASASKVNVLNNTINNNYGAGILIYFRSTENITFTNNIICYNNWSNGNDSDISGRSNGKWQNITGSGNICNVTFAYNDTGYVGCTNLCGWNEPRVEMVGPLDNNHSINLQSNVTFNCSATDATALSTVSLYLDVNGTQTLLDTQEMTGVRDSKQFSVNMATYPKVNAFKDSSYTWNCLVNNSMNLKVWGGRNFTFSGWDLGNYSNVTYNFTYNTLRLVSNGSGQYDNRSGEYISKVFDAGEDKAWLNLTWEQAGFFSVALPNNSIADSGINMTGNTLLLHMDESSGTIADSSGLNQIGTASNLVYSVAGRINQGLYFSGGANITYGKVSSFFGYSGQTISVWIKPTGAAPTATTYAYNGAGIVTTDDGDFGISQGVMSSVNSIWVHNYGNHEQRIPITYNQNEWVHVVLMFKEGYLYAYKNGKLAGSNFTSFMPTYYNLVIGGNFDGSKPFNGTIDELVIWNRTLSDAEIQNLYARGLYGKLNMTARSCDDAICAGESYTAKCTNYSYCSLTSLSNNRYFQYKINLETNETVHTPELITDGSVIVSYGAITPASSPAAAPSGSNALGTPAAMPSEPEILPLLETPSETVDNILEQPLEEIVEEDQTSITLESPSSPVAVVTITGSHGSSVSQLIDLKDIPEANSNFTQFQDLFSFRPKQNFSKMTLDMGYVCAGPRYAVLKCTDWDYEKGICKEDTNWTVYQWVPAGLHKINVTVSPVDPGLGIGPNPYSPYCGDGYCDVNENIGSCPFDCGGISQISLLDRFFNWISGRSAPTGYAIFSGQCIENWQCGKWTRWNESGMRSRECVDMNGCGTVTNKPKLEEPCQWMEMPKIEAAIGWGIFDYLKLLLLLMLIAVATYDNYLGYTKYSIIKHQYRILFDWVIDLITNVIQNIKQYFRYRKQKAESLRQQHHIEYLEQRRKIKAKATARTEKINAELSYVYYTDRYRLFHSIGITFKAIKSAIKSLIGSAYYLITLPFILLLRAFRAISFRIRFIYLRARYHIYLHHIKVAKVQARRHKEYLELRRNVRSKIHAFFTRAHDSLTYLYYTNKYRLLYALESIILFLKTTAISIAKELFAFISLFYLLPRNAIRAIIFGLKVIYMQIQHKIYLRRLRIEHAKARRHKEYLALRREVKSKVSAVVEKESNYTDYVYYSEKYKITQILNSIIHLFRSATHEIVAAILWTYKVPHRITIFLVNIINLAAAAINHRLYLRRMRIIRARKQRHIEYLAFSRKLKLKTIKEIGKLHSYEDYAYYSSKYQITAAIVNLWRAVSFKLVQAKQMVIDIFISVTKLIIALAIGIYTFIINSSVYVAKEVYSLICLTYILPRNTFFSIRQHIIEESTRHKQLAELALIEKKKQATIAKRKETLFLRKQAKEQIRLESEAKKKEELLLKEQAMQRAIAKRRETLQLKKQMKLELENQRKQELAKREEELRSREHAMLEAIERRKEAEQSREQARQQVLQQALAKRRETILYKRLEHEQELVERREVRALERQLDEQVLEQRREKAREWYHLHKFQAKLVAIKKSLMFRLRSPAKSKFERQLLETLPEHKQHIIAHATALDKLDSKLTELETKPIIAHGQLFGSHPSIVKEKVLLKKIPLFKPKSAEKLESLTKQMALLDTQLGRLSFRQKQQFDTKQILKKTLLLHVKPRYLRLKSLNRLNQSIGQLESKSLETHRAFRLVEHSDKPKPQYIEIHHEAQPKKLARMSQQLINRLAKVVNPQLKFKVKPKSEYKLAFNVTLPLKTQTDNQLSKEMNLLNRELGGIKLNNGYRAFRLGKTPEQSKQQYLHIHPEAQSKRIARMSQQLVNRLTKVVASHKQFDTRVKLEHKQPFRAVLSSNTHIYDKLSKEMNSLTKELGEIKIRPNKSFVVKKR